MYSGEFKEPTAQDYRRYEESVESERQKAEGELRERQRIAKLRNARITRPPNYTEPRTAKELKERIAKGETYFYGAILVEETIDIPLDHLNFESSIFQGCTFGRGCSLKDVIFREARLSDCILADGVSVRGADFEKAKILKVKGLFLDGNTAKGAMFEGANHPWLVLRSAYSPHRQMYHLLFGFAYFLPLLGKIIFWSALATAQSKIDPHVWRDHHFVERSVPSLLFQENGILWYLALLVLAYQGLRAFVAYRMAPLIEQETETGFAPPHESYSRYHDLHLLVCVLSLFSIIAFLVQLWLLSNGSIYIPQSLIPVH
jgi:hypothetical protein